MAKRSSSHSSHIKKLQQDVDTVFKTVYHGNGKPSIVTQLAGLESRIKSLEENIDTRINSLEKEMELKFTHIAEVVTEKFNNISNQITSEFNKKKVDAEGMWNFKTALTTTFLASATSVFVILLRELIVRLGS